MKKIRKFKKFQGVEIEFLDSIENTGGWRPLKHFDFKDHLSALSHKILGYVVKTDRDSISICRAYGLKNEDTMIGVWTVPTGAITKIRKLK